MSSQEKVFMFDGDDPAMFEANKMAQETFKYFWREQHWEYRRIVPALDLACVKLAFSDKKSRRGKKKTEHMWVSDIEFDGKYITGTLINSPNWLKSVKEGDAVKATVDELDDWMFARDGEVYGGHTVNLMRSRMGAGERRSHDKAWGLNFGDPQSIELALSGPKA